MSQDKLLPMYMQIKNYFIRKIDIGELKENDKLPSERDISEKFGISRMTARNAMQELVREGIAVRKGAKGTFVCAHKVKRNFLALEGLTEMLKESGFDDVQTDILSFEMIEADQRLSQKFSVPLGTECYHIVRRRKTSELKLVIEDVYINGEKVHGLDGYDLTQTSLWHTIEKYYGLRMANSSLTMELFYFNDEICDWLDIEKGTPGIRLSGLHFDQHGDPLEYSQIFYRGDIFCFSYELTR